LTVAQAPLEGGGDRRVHRRRATDDELHRLKSKIRDLEDSNAALEKEIHSAKLELATIRSGFGWRSLVLLRRLRARLLPSGSRSYRALYFALTGTDALLRLGVLRAVRLLFLSPSRLPTALRAAHSDGVPLNRQYQVWLERQRLTASRQDAIRKDVEGFTFRPVISILMPVFNIDQEWLKAATESVSGQLYPNWELCIVDDASTAPHIRSFLETLKGRERRIKLKFLTVNEGISGASNHALGLATGEFVAPLDHDDVLAPDALYEVVKRLNKDPSIDVFYTDHDVRDAYGVRRHPFFKPDWSPDLLLSMNYVTHFCVYRRQLVLAAGAYRKGMEGSQDYDLLLRITEITNRIDHIPKQLYSWGQAPTSVAANPGVKSYAHEAGRRALEDMMKRRGLAGEVVDGLGAPYRYRVKRAILGQPAVSIIIPSRNNRLLLERCVRSLEDRTAYRRFEILIVDNESTDPSTVEYLQHVPHHVLTHEGPFNFARMNNCAVTQARGDHLLFLNDDTEAIGSGWLEAMVEHSQRPEVGAVGARLLFPDGTIQHAGVILGIQGKAGHAFWGLPGNHPGYYDFARVVRNFSAVTAACLMTRKAVFEEVTGFDEAFDVSYNDVDLCLRLRKLGYLVVYTPYASLYHHQSASRGGYDPDKDRKYEDLLRQRWCNVFEQGDPYYNPHLTLTGYDFSLRM
jgi:GT2 family glycosyltransferase